MSSAFPTYTRPELIADGCVHAIGVIAGLIAGAILIAIALTQLSPGAAAAVVIYALGMLAVFCFSAAYNLNRGPRRWLLQRFDHAAIYVKIAATYTPFAALKMGGLAGFSLLGAVWAIAVLGAAAKLYHAGAVRAHLVRAVPGAGVGVRVRAAADDRGAVGHGAGAAADRRRALHGGRRLPPRGSACPTTTPSGTASCWSPRPATSPPCSTPWC